MITRSKLTGNPVRAFDKTYGALSGLAIGGLLGDAVRKPEDRASYGITTDFNKGVSQSISDAELVLLAVKTFIGCDGNLTSDIVIKAQLEDVAIQDGFERDGANETEAASNLRKGVRSPFSGKYNAFYMSDGSAMRIGPMGIICAGDPERAAAMAEINASVSRYRDGIREAQAMTMAVSITMVDATMERIFDAIMRVILEESWFHHAISRTFEIVDNMDGSILDTWMPLYDELYANSWAITVEALPSTFACLHMHSEVFRKGVVPAANFTRDANTIGVMAGAILGARYGTSPIPAHWVERARYPTGTCLQFTNGLDIKEMTGELARLIG